VIAGVAFLGFVYMTRDVAVRAASFAAGGRLWASIRATAKNKGFYWLMAFVMCQNASIVFLLSFFPFANQYVMRGTPRTLAILEAVVGVTVVGGMALAPRCVRRLGTLRSMRLCNLLAGAALAGLFGASFGPAWVAWLPAAGLGWGWGVIGILIQTAILDAARLERPGMPLVALGFYLGIMMAGIKLGTSAGGFLSGEVLDLAGFIPGGECQSLATLAGMRVGYVLLPLLFVGASELALRNVPRESPSAPSLAGATSNMSA